VCISPSQGKTGTIDSYTRTQTNSQEIKKSYVRCKDREKTQKEKEKISDEKKKCQKNKCVVRIGLSPKNGQRIFLNKLVPMTLIATH
jgi:hypothetical protein